MLRAQAKRVPRYYWTGLGGDSNLSTPENWLNSQHPHPGFLIVFTGSASLSPVNNYVADSLFTGILFTSTAGAFNLTGNRINLAGNITNQSASLQTLGLNIVLNPFVELWSPRQLAYANLLGWWDAADPSTVTSVNGAISSLSDKSNHGYSLIAAAANRPLYGARKQNGLNAINFDTTDTQYLSCSTGFAASGNICYWLMAAIDVIDNTGDGLFHHNGTVSNWQLVANNASQFNGRLSPGGTSTPGVAVNLSGGPFPGPSVYNVNFDFSGAAVYNVFVDGTQRAVDTTYTNKLSATGLGVFANRATGLKVSGGVDEVVMVIDDVTSTTRRLIEGYLAWKWGVQANLPGGHPYLSAPPVVTSQPTIDASSGNIQIDGILSGSGGLNKIGASSLTLTGVNTYSGDTKHLRGLLQLQSGAQISGNAIVSDDLGYAPGLYGPSTTGSSATISGTVSIELTCELAGGTFGNNTLNTGALTFEGATSILTAYSTASTFSKLAVTGNVALGGCTVNFPAGITTNGTYKLITATGTMSGTLPSVGTNSTGKSLALQQTGNDLEVVVS